MKIPTLLLLLGTSLLAPLPVAGEDEGADALAEVIARAERFQRGSADAVPTGSVHGRFWLSWRKPNGDGFFQFSVDRTYVREPERMLSRRTDSLDQTDVSEGFDGAQSWMKDNASGDAWVFDEDPETFETDLETMRQQLRIMRMVHDALTVEGIVDRLEHPRVEGQDTLRPPIRRIEGEDSRPLADVIVGTIPDELFEPDLNAPPPMPGTPEPRVHVRLAVSVKTGALLMAELRTLDRVVPRAMQLWFMNHGSNAQGLRVPQTLKAYEDGVEVVSLGVEADEDGIAGITLGDAFDEGLFAVPAELRRLGDEAEDEDG
jgi:hypothetical protein